LISCLCLVLNVIALVRCLKAENLDAMNGGWLGVFIAQTTKGAVGGGCCRMAHRTVSGAPATSPGRWVLTIGASDSWATGQSGGALDSPVVHRTVTVHCSVRLLVRALTSARVDAHCSAFNVLCRRSLARSSRCSAGTPDSLMLHRTVR
jgi:hypothetical protein